MSLSLRPVLRPSTLPSLPSASTRPTTYICTACRHARLLRRPKRVYTFTQLITLSDGSAFTIRTTSPNPVYRSTRDTRNAPLWNPTSKELMNVEDDEAGRLASFRARFGTMFDAAKEIEPTTEEKDSNDGPAKPVPESLEVGQQQQQSQKDMKAKQKQREDYEDVQYEFGEDDASLLDLISSYGQQNGGPTAGAAGDYKAGKKGKK